jgi:putative ABC transport system permease protein
MFIHYLELAARSMKRNPILTFLIVFTVSLGIAASVTMLTVLHNLSGDPLPGRSDLLYHPQIDPRPAKLRGAPIEPPDDLTYIDAVNLYKASGKSRRVLTSSNWLPVRRDAPDSAMAMYTTRATTRDFFGMFGLSFVYGGAWPSGDEEREAPWVVLSRKANDRLFNGADSVGKTLVIATRTFRVAGVVENWNPQPRFYDLNEGAFAESEQIYMPFFTWLGLPQDYGYGPMDCWDGNNGAGTHDPKAPQCTWAQFWAELRSPAEVERYRSLLQQYSRTQRQLGRFERAPNIRLRSVRQWLDYKHVIPPAVHMQTWIAFGVFFICIFNAVGLLTAKFARKSGEIGVRRALGASKRQVFTQCLSEAAAFGLAGGLLGMPLVWLGLLMVRTQPVAFASAVHLDAPMVATTLVLAIAAAILAGTWPAWRASRLAPALQVKSL